MIRRQAPIKHPEVKLMMKVIPVFHTPKMKSTIQPTFQIASPCLARILLGALLFLSACDRESPPPIARPPQQQHGASTDSSGAPLSYASILADEHAGVVVLARYGDGYEYTNRDLAEYLQFLAPKPLRGMTLAEAATRPAEEIQDWIARAVSDRVLAGEGRRMGGEAATAENLEDFKNRLIISFLGAEGITPPQRLSREDAQRRMELNRGDYTLAPAVTIQHLFFSTLQEYVLRPTDTQQSIIDASGGDPDSIWQVRDAETRRHWLTSRESFRLALAPRVRAGQRLLIPMAPEERRAIRKQAEEAMEQLRAGRNLELVGAELGFAAEALEPLGPLPAGDTALAPEIYNTCFAPELKTGETTGVIETETGFHIIRLLARQPGGLTPFETAFQRMRTEEEKTDTDQAVYAFLEDLCRQSLTFDEATLMDDQATSERVVARATDELQWTIGDLMRMDTHPKYWRRNVEVRKERIRGFNEIRSQIGAAEARRRGIQERPGYQRAIEAARDSLLAEYALQRLIEKRFTENDTLLRAYYQAHIDRYTAPPLYDLYEIAKEAPSPDSVQRIRQQLTQIKDSIASLEAFKTQALQHDFRAYIRNATGHRDWTPAAYRTPEIERAITSGPTGQVLGPFTHGNEHMLIWIEAVQPARPQPFEDVRSTVIEERRDEMIRKLEQEIREERLRRLDFKPEFP